MNTLYIASGWIRPINVDLYERLIRILMKTMERWNLIIILKQPWQVGNYLFLHISLLLPWVSEIINFHFRYYLLFGSVNQPTSKIFKVRYIFIIQDVLVYFFPFSCILYLKSVQFFSNSFYFQLFDCHSVWREIFKVKEVKFLSLQVSAFSWNQIFHAELRKCQFWTIS